MNPNDAVTEQDALYYDSVDFFSPDAFLAEKERIAACPEVEDDA